MTFSTLDQVDRRLELSPPSSCYDRPTSSIKVMPEPAFIESVDRLRALAPVAAAPIRHHVFVCTGKSCSAVDSALVKETFETELKTRGMLFGKEAKGKNPKGSIVVTECASVGFCAIGAAVMVYPDGVWYAQVRAVDVPEIIEEHLLNGRVVGRLALMKVPCASKPAGEGKPIADADWEA
jgi:(2Fe-2S) ferredoxin